MIKENPKFSYDIQKNQYIEGKDLLNIEINNKNYNYDFIFEFNDFEKFYTSQTKKYTFIAKLTPEIIKKESNFGSYITKISDSKDIEFSWNSYIEIIHIDITEAEYKKIKDNYKENVIYFITDVGENSTDLFDNLIETDENELGAIDDIIKEIRNTIKDMNKIGFSYKKIKEAGLDPAIYGINSE